MPKHVLQFFSTLNNGGAENRMMDVYRCIDSNIVMFDFAVLHKGKHDFDDEILSGGSKKYVLPDPRKGLVNNYIKIYRFFKQHEEFIAVHAHMNWYSGIVLLAAKHAGIKVRIAHARNLIDPNRSLRDKFFCNIGKVLIKIASTHRIAISDEAARAIFGNSAVTQKKYIFVPNAIDEKKYSVLCGSERDLLREKLGIPKGKKALVTVANLRKQKNHEFLIEIAQSLKQLNFPFVLYLIGEGELRETIEENIRKLKLEDYVILLGKRDDVPKILSAFDGMVFPSLYEGLGGVVLEAQLVGIPSVVSTGIPLVADVGIDMVEFVSLRDSADVWAHKIIDKLQNYTWSYDKAIKAFHDKGYSINSTARTYLELYGIDKETINIALG